MADKEIKIMFPEEKMEALSFFMKQKDMDIEKVLKEHLDKTYEKVVPAPVREFTESKLVGEEPARTNRASQRSETTQARPNTRRGRQAERDTREEQEISVEETGNHEMESEENQGMQMSM